MVPRRLAAALGEGLLRRSVIRLYAELEEAGARPLTEEGARDVLTELAAIRARIDEAEAALGAMELGPVEPNSALDLLRLEHGLSRAQHDKACLVEETRILAAAVERAEHSTTEHSATEQRRARNKRKRNRKRQGR